MGFILVLMIELLAFCFVMLAKNKNTYKNITLLHNAISKWGMDNINVSVEEFKEMLDSMESYESTLFRLTDWGYTKILPADKYEKIKDYIS